MNPKQPCYTSFPMGQCFCLITARAVRFDTTKLQHAMGGAIKNRAFGVKYVVQSKKMIAYALFFVPFD